ncbi:MAG: hypothetical protein KR126chlam6_00118 [Candidatus Anoxychlamydiales bacterium]|nr:hypothetical protein [Candidatus Anoxychlamydiales bacterium]
MLYLIDGYNILFKFFHSEKDIQTQRDLIIKFFQDTAEKFHLKIHLIFDAHKQQEVLATHTYDKHLKVIFTPKDQTADEYILEQIFLSKTPSQITLITSDNSLTFQAKHMKAHTKSVDEFIDWLSEKEIKKETKKLDKEEFVDTKHDIQRLLKIFEEKLDDDNF